MSGVLVSAPFEALLADGEKVLFVLRAQVLVRALGMIDFRAFDALEVNVVAFELFAADLRLRVVRVLGYLRSEMLQKSFALEAV